jgi:TPR repeat protein
VEGTAPSAYSTCVYLGQMYEKGEGVAQDIKESLFYYKKSCDIGNDKEACKAVGHLYESAKDIPKDLHKVLSRIIKRPVMIFILDVSNLKKKYSLFLRTNSL